MDNNIDNQSFTKHIRIGDAKVFINPGSGPVDNASEENAIKNMRQFVIDSVADGFERQPNLDENGRFGFVVYCNKYPDMHISIDMPGLPIEQVRYIGDDNQNPWDFPRLYVDGSSWLWKFAILKDYDWTGEDE